MRLKAFFLSDVGLVREQNEDSSGFFPDQKLFIVADGMGGHAGGKEASQIAVQTIEERFLAKLGEDRSPDPEEPEVSRLMDGIFEANRRILEHAATDQSLKGMGTTIVALVFGKRGAAIAHVGDSRAYRLRDGRVELLTADHSLVADLVRRNELSEAEASRHPYRHVLTRALGIAEDVTPEVARTEIRRGDLYLLCSDGVYGMISPEEFGKILLGCAEEEPEEVCRRLIAAANAGGGKDNATVIAVQCVCDERLP